MRRIAALLVLLVFGLGQAAASECPMAPDAGAGARSAAAVHAHHHHHPAPATDAHHPAHSQGPAHGQAACALAMSCGAVAAISIGAAPYQPPIRLAQVARRLPHLYTSPVLTTDSPPPRA
jgi:hypothetical protein